MADVIRRIKAETPLALTLSLVAATRTWSPAAARTVTCARFETSNRQLYERLHPSRPGTRSDRLAILGKLRELGYEVGSGVMIGIPGQTYEDLARDIELFGKLDLDMIGVGPFLVHPDTPLGDPDFQPLVLGCEQVPGDELTTYKVMALAASCALAQHPEHHGAGHVEPAERPGTGWCGGANVVMPNLTPLEYRVLYEIYPNKACIRETADACHTCPLANRVDGASRRHRGAAIP